VTIDVARLYLSVILDVTGSASGQNIDLEVGR
jgi:hypothetical protein